MSAIVVTLIGPDRPGVVRAISDKAAAHGANWADSVMANFAGQFAGIVHLQVPAANSQALLAALRSLEADNLHVQVALADDASPGPVRRRLNLTLVGHDRPGIIHSIATRLAAQPRHHFRVNVFQGDRLQVAVKERETICEKPFGRARTLDR